MSLLDVRVQEGDGAVHLELSGELDLSTAPQVEDCLRTVEERRPPLVVLDLRELRFMDSTGLRLILSADARAREESRRFGIVPGPESVQRVFEITGLEMRLELVDPASGDSTSPSQGA